MRKMRVRVAMIVAFATAIGCLKDIEPPKSEGTVKDPANQEYVWRLMNDGKIWMMENLNYEVPGGNSWWYNHDPDRGNEFGRLYDWQTGVDACAALGSGWRLPEEWEWNSLVAHNGGWDDPHVLSWSHKGYSNLIRGGSSGFNALLGGWRWYTGNFSMLYEQGSYWTASETGAATAYVYIFRSDVPVLERAGYDKQLGASCRCVFGGS